MTKRGNLACKSPAGQPCDKHDHDGVGQGPVERSYRPASFIIWVTPVRRWITSLPEMMTL